MLDMKQILKAYPQSLHVYGRSLLREYLQYKILQAIFENKFSEKISFLGGTAIRIIHGNYRFSEDIDLDHFGLDWNAFEEVIFHVQRHLELEGFKIEMRLIEKGAYHCMIRFPKILFDQGYSPFPHKKIAIRIDTFSQGYRYQPDIRIINKFDVFCEVRVTPLSILLSQKIFTSINRKRPKGRDFYDITYLMSMASPDFGFLKLKMGVDNEKELRTVYSKAISNYDFKYLADDVAPFLIDNRQLMRVLNFRQFWDQTPLQ